MPIVVKASPSDGTHDVIKKFKKVAVASGIVDRAKNNQFNRKPSQVRAAKKAQLRKLRKRARSLKKMKNVNPESLARIRERLSSS